MSVQWNTLEKKEKPRQEWTATHRLNVVNVWMSIRRLLNTDCLLASDALGESDVCNVCHCWLAVAWLCRTVARLTLMTAVWVKHSSVCSKNSFSQFRAVNKRCCLYPEEDTRFLNSAFFFQHNLTPIPSVWQKVGTTLYIKEMSGCFETTPYLVLVEPCLKACLAWKSLLVLALLCNEGSIGKASVFFAPVGRAAFSPPFWNEKVLI